MKRKPDETGKSPEHAGVWMNSLKGMGQRENVFDSAKATPNKFLVSGFQIFKIRCGRLLLLLLVLSSDLCHAHSINFNGKLCRQHRT